MRLRCNAAASSAGHARRRTGAVQVRCSARTPCSKPPCSPGWEDIEQERPGSDLTFSRSAPLSPSASSISNSVGLVPQVKSRKTATDETRSSKGEDAAAGRVSELAQESRFPFYAAYWDGTGHMRAIQVRKGDSIGEFLRANHQQLAPEFHQVRTTSVQNLLYIRKISLSLINTACTS
ncbi:hypothetical protein ZWY2020_045902 [Hordeum vulgare]|nr:hypothetical protein ZWY2020_045902 [Hordeum vulgare]